MPGPYQELSVDQENLLEIESESKTHIQNQKNTENSTEIRVWKWDLNQLQTLNSNQKSNLNQAITLNRKQSPKSDSS